MNELSSGAPKDSDPPDAIGRLLVIAGPTASGKSTLIRALASDAPPAWVGSTIDLGNLDRWKWKSTHKTKKFDGHTVRQLGVHHSLLLGAKGFDKLEALLARAREISCLTVWTSPEVLIPRIEKRMQLQEGRGSERVVDLYRQVNGLIKRYDDWFAMIAAYPVATHWLVDGARPDMPLIPLAGWPALRDAALTAAAPL